VVVKSRGWNVLRGVAIRKGSKGPALVHKETQTPIKKERPLTEGGTVKKGGGFGESIACGTQVIAEKGR